MEDEGIEDGDLVVIRQEPDPKEGDLVIALDEENRNTLKKYGGKAVSSHFVSLWGRSCWTPFSGRTRKAAGAASRLLMRSRIP